MMWGWQRSAQKASRNSEAEEANKRLSDKYFDEKKAEFEILCDQGDSGGCFSLGEWYLYFAKNEEKGYELFKKACYEMHNGNACFNLGQAYRGSKFDLDINERKLKVVELNKLACEYGNHSGCSMSGLMLLQGFGCEKDFNSGVQHLEKACDANDSHGCFYLGRYYLEGDKYGKSRDAETSSTYMRKSCQLGHPNACQILSVMYRKGDGVKKSTKQSDFYRQRTLDIARQTGERMGVTVVD